MKVKMIPAILFLVGAFPLLNAQTPETPPPEPPPIPAPEAAPSPLDVAKAKFREGDFPNAFAAAEAALTTQPDSAVANYIAGASLIRLSRLDEAATHLAAVLEKAPTMPLLHYQLGLLSYRRAEEAEKAKNEEQAKTLYLEGAKEFAIELEKTPTQLASLAARAAALSHAAATEEAIPAHEAWIVAAPDANEPFLSLAAVYANAGRIEEGLAQLERLPQKDPKLVGDAATAMAQSLYTRKKNAETIALAGKALELDPASTRALSLLIAAHANSGHVDETAQGLAKYLALNPPAAEVEEVADVIAQRFGEDAGAISSVPVGVTTPSIVKGAKPRYPVAAGRARIETKVLLFVQVRADGSVGEIVVVPSRLGKDMKDLGFADGAIETVKKMRFKPGEKSGQPMDMYMPVTIRFVP